MIPELSVGIDYHDECLQVCVLNKDGEVIRNVKIANDVGELIRTIGVKSQEVSVAAEACSGSAALLDAVHGETSWRVQLCHPGYAQRMRNNRDKTDKSDSELIADLTRIGYLPEVWLAPVELRDLRSLVRYRSYQMREARSMKQRIRGMLSNNRVKVPKGLSLWTKAGIAWLKSTTELREHASWIMSRYIAELARLLAEVKISTERLHEFVKHDQVAKKLLKQRGIGVVTAAVMRAEIGTFTRFKNGKQLAKYCGLSPCNRSSGNVSADCGVIQAGNKILKACIAQGVWTLIRYDEQWKKYAQGLLERGKPKGVVASAIANRWIRKLFHAVKDY